MNLNTKTDVLKDMVAMLWKPPADKWLAWQNREVQSEADGTRKRATGQNSPIFY